MSERTLVAVGLTGIAVAVVLSLVLVQRIGTAYGAALDVTAEAAALATDAAEPIGAMTDEVAGLAAGLADGMDTARTVVGSAATTMQEVGVAAAGDVAATADAVAALADRVADVAETIERFIPGSSPSAAEDLRQLADSLAPTSERLRTLGAQLESTATELTALDPTLDDLETQLTALSTSLEQLAPSSEELASTATQLAADVEAAQQRLDSGLWLARIVVALVGGVMAITLLLAARDRPIGKVSGVPGSA